MIFPSHINCLHMCLSIKMYKLKCCILQIWGTHIFEYIKIFMNLNYPLPQLVWITDFLLYTDMSGLSNLSTVIFEDYNVSQLLTNIKKTINYQYNTAIVYESIKCHHNGLEKIKKKKKWYWCYHTIISRILKHLRKNMRVKRPELYINNSSSSIKTRHSSCITALWFFGHN